MTNEDISEVAIDTTTTIRLTAETGNEDISEVAISTTATIRLTVEVCVVIILGCNTSSACAADYTDHPVRRVHMLNRKGTLI